MPTKAKEIIIPPTGVFRLIFLYVGQGDATILVVPDGAEFKYVLLDNNIDRSAGGINTGKLLKDLLDDELDVFINTHPHRDHTEGIEAIHNAVGVKEVWHSGHVPGKENDGAYQEMRRVILDIGKEHEYKLYGTDTLNKIRQSDGETEEIKLLGDINYQVLSPAEYLCEEIAEGGDAERDQRIHEHCAVLRFSYGTTPTYVLFTGDSDRVAWEEHIMPHHREAVQADVLSASHHGSRTFFKYADEEPYEEHLESIQPSVIIVSAPKKDESRHKHPHDDAMELYRKRVDEDNLLHSGKNRESVIVDIASDGSYDVRLDQELVKAYGYGNEDDGDKGSRTSSTAVISSGTRLDSKPMG
jgi:competence protein ComEC